jgi:Recombination directionality factor-like
MPLAEPDLLGLARQSLPLGEMRIGESEEVPGKAYRKPKRRETFRFTTPSQDTAIAVAEHYGGDPAPWDRRRGYWVVDTDVAKVDVWVPPRGLAVDTNMELWGGKPVKNLRWCNGKIERRSGQPCMCPMPDDPDDPDDVQRAYDERQRLAKDGRACKVRTRYNLAIPELPGLVGVWKLLTGSANAARWSADCGDILERARAAKVFLPASCEITWWPGQDGSPYPVPILRPKQSALQLAAGELPSGLNGLLQQLTAGGVNGSGPLALTAGNGAQVSVNGAEASTTVPEPPQATPPPPARAPERRRSQRTAQDIADDAMQATTCEEIKTLIGEARALRAGAKHVFTDPSHEVQEELRPFLTGLWNTLPSAGGSAA